jgi:uracil-DNA glycosylase
MFMAVDHNILELSMQIWSCNECKKVNKISIKRDPSKGLVPICFAGKPYAKIWFIGLNPKLPNKEHRYDDSIFNEYFDRNIKYEFTYQYFTQFEPIFKRINHILGKNLSVRTAILSNDLVKCSSNTWNVTNTDKLLTNKNQQEIIKNCSKYLWKQIEYHKPLIIICNGVEVSRTIYNHYRTEDMPLWDTNKPPEDIELTHSFTERNHSFAVFLSGFINRSDTLTKIRLADDIIKVISKNPDLMKKL